MRFDFKPVLYTSLFLLVCVIADAQTEPADTVSEQASTSVSSGYKDIPYDTLPSKFITGAVDNIKGSSLEKNFTLNIGSALYGRVSGLLMQQGSSEPGVAVPNMYIRGITAFGDGNNAPLYVIDGIIASGSGSANPLMQMIPEEIEDITVLKDAASTAIYGMRAANGVVLVTTKKGVNGPLKVSFTTKQGINQAQQLPEFLGAYDYARLYVEAQKNDGVSVPKYSSDDLEAYRLGNDPVFHPDVNWYDEILRKSAPVSSYDLNLRGGGSYVKYFVALNALNSQGILKKFGDMSDESANARYSKYNFRTNIEVELSQRLSVDFRIGGYIEQSLNPYGYTTSGIFDQIASLPPNSFPVKNPNGTWGGNTVTSNPNPYANLLDLGSYRKNSRTILSSLKLTEQLDFITKGLSVSGLFSLNNYFVSGSMKTKSYTSYSISKNADGDTVYSAPIGQTTLLTGNDANLDEYRNWVLQGFLNYKRSFGKSDVRALLMINTDNMVLYGPQNNPSKPDASSTEPYKHNDLAARVNYAFDNRYVLEGSVARTGSNLFPKGHQYGIFPAGALAWIASNELFLKGNESVNFLKLRASYGLTGNDIIRPLGTDRYTFLPFYGSDPYYFGTGNTSYYGYYEFAVAVQNLTWQKETQLNLGADLTLFRNLDISLDVFDRNRSGILTSAAGTLPMFLGVNIPELNLGKTNNKGIEGTITYHNNRNHKLNFFIEVNVAYNKTRVVFNAEPFQINKNLYSTGLRIGQPIGLHAIGFYSEEDIAKREHDPKSVPGVITETIRAGDIKYADIGGPAGVPDGIIDGYDRMPIGNPSTPDLFGGLHAGLKYKGFDVDIVFQGATGNTVYLGGNYFQAFQNNGQVGPIALGRWTPENEENATYPRLSSKDNLNNYQYSDFWMRDGSFVKLRSLELGYSVPAALFKKLHVETFRFFINGTNLFSLDKIPYGDPESLTGYPVLRTVTAGVNIQL